MSAAAEASYYPGDDSYNRDRVGSTTTAYLESEHTQSPSSAASTPLVSRKPVPPPVAPVSEPESQFQRSNPVYEANTSHTHPQYQKTSPITHYSQTQPGLEVYHGQPRTLAETYPETVGYSSLEVSPGTPTPAYAYGNGAMNSGPPVPVASAAPPNNGGLAAGNAPPAPQPQHNSAFTENYDVKSPTAFQDSSVIAGTTKGDGGIPLPGPGKDMVQSPTRKNRRRNIIIGIAALAILIIIGLVLGIVLGLKAKNKDKGGSNEGGSAGGEGSSDIPLEYALGDKNLPRIRPENTASGELVRERGGLAAVSFANPKEEGGYTLRLFYQDKAENLRMSSYDSNSDEWSDSGILGTAQGWTGIAAGQIEDKTHVFFLDADNCTQEMIIDLDGQVEDGTIGDICDEAKKPYYLGRMAMLYPHLFYQDDEGYLNQFLFSSSGGKLSAEAVHHKNALAFKGQKGSGLAIMSNSRTSGDEPKLNTEDVSVIYQDKDWKINEWTAGDNGNWTVDFKPAEWVPTETAFGAFSVLTRSTSESKSLSLQRFIIYQELEGHLSVYLKLGRGLWTGPEKLIEALKEVNVGSPISCITMPYSGRTDGEELGRCFMQTISGQLREVLYAKGEWVNLGTIRGL